MFRSLFLCKNMMSLIARILNNPEDTLKHLPLQFIWYIGKLLIIVTSANLCQISSHFVSKVSLLCATANFETRKVRWMFGESKLP